MTAPKKKPRAKASPRKKAASKKSSPTPDLVRAIAEDIPAMLEPPAQKKGFWARLFGR